MAVAGDALAGGGLHKRRRDATADVQRARAERGEAEKAKFYEQYKEAKEELLKLQTAKQNVASFFREEEPAQQER